MEDKWLKSPGFRQSVRETDEGRKGDLVGGISLVGYRGCGRPVSYGEKKKKKANRKRLMHEKKQLWTERKVLVLHLFLHFKGLDS